MAEIEFRTVRRPYECPTCHYRITIRPCPACVARTAQRIAAARKDRAGLRGEGAERVATPVGRQRKGGLL